MSESIVEVPASEVQVVQATEVHAVQTNEEVIMKPYSSIMAPKEEEEGSCESNERPTADASAVYINNNGRSDFLTVTWMNKFNELSSYREEFGHCNVTSSGQGDPRAPLARWANKQRNQYKILTGQATTSSAKLRMNQEMVDMLNSIGFVWDTCSAFEEVPTTVGKRGRKKGQRGKDTPWKTRLQELIEYKEKYGDCLVPYKYPENVQLGRWVSVQRYMYNEWKRGKKNTMTSERIQTLEDLGFCWEATGHASGYAAEQANSRLVEIREAVEEQSSSFLKRKASHNALDSMEDNSKREKVSCSALSSRVTTPSSFNGDGLDLKKGPKPGRPSGTGMQRTSSRPQSYGDRTYVSIEGMKPGESMYEKYILSISDPRNVTESSLSSKNGRQKSKKPVKSFRNDDLLEWV